MEQYNVILNKFPANPRSKRRLASQGFFGSESSSGGSNIGGSSFSGYWDLITTNAAGEALEEGKEYIRTKYSAVSEKDVVAFSTEEPVADIDFPIASYNQIGLVGVTQGGGLIIDSNGYIRVDESILEGGGFDEAELRKFLNDNHYLTPTTSLYGYIPLPDNPLITAGDSVNNAFKKLELKVVDMVTISTDQTITGQKTFAKTILAQKDVIAFVSGQGEDAELPVASTTQVGMVGIKSGGGIVIDTNGYISVDPSFEGGGSGIELVVSSGTGNAVTSLTYNKTTKTLTYVKDSTFALLSQIPTALKNPYSLSWSGYSSGSYDGSSSKSISIPSNTSQLTNGAGFIKDGNGTFTVLSGSGSSSKYLAGNGTFYSVGFSELSGIPSWIAGWDTNRFNLNSNGGAVFKSAGTMTSFTHSDSPISYLGVEIYNNQVRGTNTQSAYAGTKYVGNLYLNYVDDSTYVRIDNYGTLSSTGDVIAFSIGSASEIAGTATSSTYGLVKYDNSTIKINSLGQLYAVNSGGGGSSSVAWSDITGKPSWIGSNKPSYTWSEISGKPSWIGSSKPSYSWSEIGSKPSGLVTSVSINGSGNVIASASFSGGTLTLTRGTVSGGGSSWDTNRFNLNSNGGAMFKSTGSMFTPTHSDSRASETGVEIYNNQVRGVHSGSSSNYYVNNLYLNYVSSSKMGVRIDASGNLTSYGNGTWSDMRLKDYISDVVNVLPSILKVGVFRYKMKNWDDSPILIGVSAQAVLPLFPEVVNMDEEGYYSVDYSKLSILSFVGIRELYGKHMLLDNLVRGRLHWEFTKDQQIKFLQETVIRLQNEINELKEGRAA